MLTKIPLEPTKEKLERRTENLFMDKSMGFMCELKGGEK
jgi:hypothetical protein